MVTGTFLLVSAVTFLFFLYVGVQVPLVPRLIEDGLGGSEADIGLNLAVFSVAAIAVRPLLGPWGDRWGRRSLMSTGSLLAGVMVLAMTAVDDRFLLLPLRALAGIGEAALFVGAATMINDLAPAHRRAEAASYFSIAVFGGLGVGPILGEVLIEGERFDRGLVAAGVCALLAGALAFTVPSDAARRAAAHRALHGGAAPRAPRFHPAALRPGLVLAFGIGGFTTFNAFMPDHADRVGLDGSKWVFALYSGVCLVVRIVGARVPERIGLGRSVVLALVLLTLGLAGVAAVATPAGVYGGTLVLALGMAFMYPALMAITVNAVVESERASAISTFTMFFEIGTAVGALAFGAVAEVAGKRGGFLAGAVSAALGLWCFASLVGRRRRTRPIPASGSPVGAAR